MHYIRFAIATCVALGLGGCATPYVNNSTMRLLGSHMGYADYEGAGRLIRVTFVANDFTTSRDVEVYILRHCAEIAKSKNFKYFQIYDNPAMAIRHQPASIPTTVLLNGDKRPIGETWLFLTSQDTSTSFDADAVIAEAQKYSEAKQASNN